MALARQLDQGLSARRTHYQRKAYREVDAAPECWLAEQIVWSAKVFGPAPVRPLQQRC
jgi:hypothetical protein